MKLAMIGLGKMGANMVRRLHGDGHEIVIYDVSTDAVDTLTAELSATHIQVASTIKDVINLLEPARVIWLMVPHQFVDQSIDALLEAGLAADDVLIDGGNSNYRLSQQRAARLQQQGIYFVDAGTSGGVWGLENGYSMMVGGDTEAIRKIEPVLKSLAPGADRGWGHVGSAGAGHYVKMVHNGIEYGMMQAYAEGFELMQSNPDMELDLQQIAAIWQHGSVVRSWLLDLVADALQQDATMSALSDYVEDSGEGRWTIQESIDTAVPTPVLTLALQMRFRSRQSPSFAGKLLNAMRAGFGGHPIKPANEDS